MKIGNSVSILQAGDRKLNHVFYYENVSYKEEKQRCNCPIKYEFARKPKFSPKETKRCIKVGFSLNLICGYTVVTLNPYWGSTQPPHPCRGIFSPPLKTADNPMVWGFDLPCL